MYTPCCPRAGPPGGAGLAFPAGICNLTGVLTSSAKPCPSPLQPLDLRKPQLPRSAPAKNADQDFHPPAFLIDLVHHPVAPEERSVDAAYVGPFVKFLFLAGHPCPAVDLLAERLDLLLRQGDGVRAPAHKAGDLRGLLDHLPGLVRHVHFDQNIAGEKFPSRGAFLAFLDLDHVLGRHQHLSDLVLQAHLVRALHNAVLHTALEARIGVHNVPVLAHDAVLAHSIFTISKLIKISANLKNSDTISTKTITTVVDPIVSLRLGYEIFFSSERTSLKNSTRAALVCANIFFFQAEDGIRNLTVTGVQTCALPIFDRPPRRAASTASCSYPDTCAMSPDWAGPTGAIGTGMGPSLSTVQLTSMTASSGRKIGRASCRERV